MKLLLLKTLFLLAIIGSFAQKDTIVVNTKNLKIKDLHFGNSTYIIYSKNGENKQAQRNTLVKINVSKQNYNGVDGIPTPERNEWLSKILDF